MRLSVVIPAAVLLACSGLAGLGVVSGSHSWPARSAVAEPRTGMDILNAYACGRGETKRIIIRGVEDGYSPAGDEAGYIREGRNHAGWLPRDGTGVYDQVNADRGLVDSFNVKGPVASGIFLFRARSLNGSDNDTLSFGDLAGAPGTATDGARAAALVRSFRTDEVWTTDGDVTYAEIRDITLNPHHQTSASPRTAGPGSNYSLKSYLNDPATPEWLDVFVQDDTVVDFIGLALCSPPVVKRGLTLKPFEGSIPMQTQTAHLVCHSVRNTEDRCDPYVGDTVCSAERAVACLRPGNAPSPMDADGKPLFAMWSGGEIAVTEPVRGDRFRTVRDVEDFCVQRFGIGWRVASLHDGIRNQSISGLGDQRSLTSRVWVDIGDQTHATCWARE